MVLENPNNGENQTTEPDLWSSHNNGETFETNETHRFSEEIDSACSTPYVSAPSSPGRGQGTTGYFFSAPASPMHYVLSSSAPPSPSIESASSDATVSGSFEFEFSSRFSPNSSVANGSMSSADELFFNGQIRPMKLSSHLQRPQILTPLLDLEVEEEDEDNKDLNVQELVTRGRDLRLRNRSMHRKARSLSPLRNVEFQWHEEEDVHERPVEINERVLDLEDQERKQRETPSSETTPSVSASSSRSSSSGRNSKKWIFLKDLLYRSKSEGRENSKEKFWSSISFSPSKDKKLTSPSLALSSSRDEKEKTETTTTTTTTTTEKEKPKEKRSKKATNKKHVTGKPTNGVGKRRVPLSAHELHYTANRAQAEELKKKTFLPYRQGLLGCLGFSSKGYGALNGLTRTLNPVSSR